LTGQLRARIFPRMSITAELDVPDERSRFQMPVGVARRGGWFCCAFQ
jgi:hypothetical protein